MTRLPITQLTWNLDEIISSDDNTFHSFAEDLQNTSTELQAFQKKLSNQHISSDLTLLTIIKNAEALLNKAYTLQLSIQIVATARNEHSDLLPLLQQQATAVYNACLSAVGEQLRCISPLILESRNSELSPYRVFLGFVQPNTPQPIQLDSDEPSSDGKHSDYSALIEYYQLRRSMHLEVASVDPNPLSITDTFLVLRTDCQENQQAAFAAYSNWMQENQGVFSSLYSRRVLSTKLEREQLRHQPWRSYSARESIIPEIHSEFVLDSNAIGLFHRFERARLGLSENEEAPFFRKFTITGSCDNESNETDSYQLLLAGFGSLSSEVETFVGNMFAKGRIFTNSIHSPNRGINCVGVPNIGPFISAPMRSGDGALLTRLAHELGHAYQKSLAGNCSYFCHGIERLLSESIATFFEIWILDFILKRQEPHYLSTNQRIAFLTSLFEDLFERTAMAMYENTCAKMTESDLANPQILSEIWRKTHQPLLHGLYSLPSEFDHWWIDNSMMFRYPLAQSYYPAATLLALALFFKAQQNPVLFMKNFNRQIALGGTIPFSSWGDPLEIDMHNPQSTKPAILFLQEAMHTIEP